MENNTLAILVAVILMGTMAVMMIVTTSAGNIPAAPGLNFSFQDHERSDLASEQKPN